jgi:hypothetical protein
MVRSLGRRGVPVYVTGTEGHFVSYSRWHRPAPAERGEPPSPATLSDCLTGLPQQQGMVLSPPTDEWALAGARLPAPLAARFPASRPGVGVPHPRSVRVALEDDRARLPADAFADAFLKPCGSQAFRRRFGVKALHFKTPAEAIALARD